MRVAIIHYWLFHMRGGEKVLEALCEMFPEADIYTHVYDCSGVSETIKRHNVRTTFINNLPFARQQYQKYLPLMPLALEQLDLTSYDLVISSESGPAKGIITRPDALHICYCHTPMRYLWDQYPLYLARAGRLTRWAMPWMFHKLRLWDHASASRVDYFVANSTAVSRRIAKYYRRESTVIHPPVDVDAFDIGETIGEYYLYLGQLVSYKRADLAIRTFNQLGLPLVVIGEGEEARRLEREAKSNIEFLGKVRFDVLRSYLGRCKALVFPGEEDFGIVPVEAMASGRPVLAFRRGGALDTVVENVTGLFFDEPSVESLAECVGRFEQVLTSFEPSRLRKHAMTFEKQVFKEKFLDFVRRAVQNGRCD